MLDCSMYSMIFTLNSMIMLIPISQCDRINSVRSDICSRFPELSWCNDAQTRLKNPSIPVQQMSDINAADKVRYCRTYEKSFYDNCSAPIRIDYNRIKFCKAYFNYCDVADKLAPLRKPSPQ